MTDTEILNITAVKPVEPPMQFKEAIVPELTEATRLIRAGLARNKFGVDGRGAAVAVLDTGLRTTHRDFAGRVIPGRNFTNDNGGDPNDPSDGQGHGTNVSGVICAGDIHMGIAPGAHVVPLKVLGNDGGGDFQAIADALQWVLDHHAKHGIGVVCMSLGDSGNYLRDNDFPNDAIGNRIAQLAAQGVACCIAAGNGYFGAGSAQGMSYPAIFRDAISVGAVYDDNVGSFAYQDGARAVATAADRIAPFSQRLHEKVGGPFATDIFAPGAPMTSSGKDSDVGQSIDHGTSQAAPVAAGVILLLQQFHREKRGTLPSVADLRRWIVQSAAIIVDGDDEQDNVLHSGLSYRRIDALAALQACATDIAVALHNAA